MKSNRKHLVRKSRSSNGLVRCPSCRGVGSCGGDDVCQTCEGFGQVEPLDCIQCDNSGTVVLSTDDQGYMVDIGPCEWCHLVPNSKFNLSNVKEWHEGRQGSRADITNEQ